MLRGGTIKLSPRKDDMIRFPFNENRFSFFVAVHLLVGQLCTNPKSGRSLLSCLKVTQCSTSEIGDAVWQKPCHIFLEKSDFHTINNLLVVVHIFSMDMLTSISVDEILLPSNVN